jgi:hypothetical protein
MHGSKAAAHERLLVAETVRSRRSLTAVLRRDCQIARRQLSTSVANE